MCRDGNALLQAHQLGQHQGAGNHRNVPIACSQHFGVVGLDGGGSHHRIRTGYVAGVVPIGGNAQRSKTLQVALSARSDPEMV